MKNRQVRIIFTIMVIFTVLFCVWSVNANSEDSREQKVFITFDKETLAVGQTLTATWAFADGIEPVGEILCILAFI